MPIVSIRDNSPAVDVKDHTAYAHTEPYAALIRELPEEEVESIYNDTLEHFWYDLAPTVAEDHGYSREIYYEGRSGGWLVPTGKGLDWGDTLDCIDGNPLRPVEPMSGSHPCQTCEGTGREDVCGNPDTPCGGCGGNGIDAETSDAWDNFKRFMRFAEAIDKAMETARTYFLEELHESVAELNVRREAAIVRGEN